MTRWHEFEDRALESMVLSCSRVSNEGYNKFKGNSYKLYHLNESKSFCHFQAFVAINFKIRTIDRYKYSTISFVIANGNLKACFLKSFQNVCHVRLFT